MQLEGGVNSNRAKVWFMTVLLMNKKKNMTHDDFAHDSHTMTYNDIAHNHFGSRSVPYTLTITEVL